MDEIRKCKIYCHKNKRFKIVSDVYQQVLASASIYQIGLVKARNGSVYKLFSNARMHRQNLGLTNLRAFTVTYIYMMSISDYFGILRCIYVCMDVCMYVCIICMYVCMYVCMYYMYVCTYVCMYVCR
jgi:hypothetical protein